MGRPSAVAMTALLVTSSTLFSLQLLLLPTPASSVLPAAAVLLHGATMLATPIIKQVVKDYVIKKGKQGVSDISQQGKSESEKGGQLGSAAAGSVGLVVLGLNVGTPANQKISFVMDITYTGVWAQCAACIGGSCKTTATFRPDDSRSFSPVPCNDPMCMVTQVCASDNFCRYTALNSDSTVYSSGFLAMDTFTVGDKPVSFSMVFGCSSQSSSDFSASGASGVIGFARGGASLSLVSQQQLSKFSYLLATDDTDGSNSVIRLGDDAVPQTKGSRSTPLLTSNMYPQLYYVRLTGIQVDGQDLSDFPAGALELASDGTGGVYLSTTLPTTYLEVAAYSVLRRALVNKIQEQRLNPVGDYPYQLCYMTTDFDKINNVVPKLTLVLNGGAAMELRTENYFFAADGKTCLSILPSSGVSVLGSLLQTGTNMIYDIQGKTLTFETAAAASAASHSQLSFMIIIAPLLLIWVLLF